ncbi:hypothetical protein VPH35_001546 [Triticum aestivum]
MQNRSSKISLTKQPLRYCVSPCHFVLIIPAKFPGIVSVVCGQTNLPPSYIHCDSVLNVFAGVSGLIVPAATVGALGYGYMWWKGISFGDLMYVTKQNMANVVSSMTKHLEQVQSSLAAAKKHLTQRIEKLDDKLDQQKALSGQIKDDVTGARLKLENIGSEIKNIKELVWGLDEKMDSMEAKQNFSCAGVMYLCQFIEQSGGKLPERLEGIKPSAKRFETIGIQGLQLAIETGNFSDFSNADSTDKISRSNSLKSAN